MPPEIDYENCTGCGKCVDVCAEDVFFDTEGFGKIKGKKPVVTYPEACWHCYLCIKECPANGIRLRTPLVMTIHYK